MFYWFEKARDLIEHDDCERAGLLGTQAIRGGANREEFGVSGRVLIANGAIAGAGDFSAVADDDRPHRDIIPPTCLFRLVEGGRHPAAVGLRWDHVRRW